MACSHASSCALFPLFSSNRTLEMWKRMYCESDKHVECARFQQSCDMKAVPITLLPNGQHLAVAPGGK